jgi:hypothetical protein
MKTKNIPELELTYRFWAKVVLITSMALSFLAGFMEGMAGYEIYPAWLFSIFGLVILAGASVYFYYKGKHYKIDNDQMTYLWLLGIIILYAITVGVFWGLLVGPIQYAIGRLQK